MKIGALLCRLGAGCLIGRQAVMITYVQEYFRTLLNLKKYIRSYSESYLKCIETWLNHKSRYQFIQSSMNTDADDI